MHNAEYVNMSKDKNAYFKLFIPASKLIFFSFRAFCHDFIYLFILVSSKEHVTSESQQHHRR